MWKTAFSFMVYDKAKLIGILFGIVISVFLIGAQLGLLDGFLEASLGIIKGNTEYIFVVNEKSESSISLVNVDKRVGYELQSIPGVNKVHPVIVTGGMMKNSSGGTAGCSLVGIKAPDYVGAPKQFLEGTNLKSLQSEGAVIVDESDLENLGKLKQGDYFSINDVRVYISGISIGNAGLGEFNMVSTIERVRKLSGFSPNHVSAYIVEADTQDPMVKKRIADTITATIPTVKAYVGDTFKDVTLDYMGEASGIVGTFMILVWFSLVTGLVIVGLTMFSAVNDRIKDYGTIKAIGGGNWLITKLIMIQSIFYSICGFSFTMLLLIGLKYFMKSINQSMDYAPERIIFLIFSTLLISLAGSYFSMRKILKLEPVQIFRM
ncbi:ABC transporter permease [Limibacter armeniacum]|uniref:ABC transporter permease n=1 Tax=Limibacter armeniacum TaxID=466084 RepID=UPI002FE62D94